MIVAEIIFAIVLAVSILVGILGSKYLQIMRERQAGGGNLERETAARLARLETLEERVTVLEKIVTDRKYEIDEQFRNLEKAG